DIAGMSARLPNRLAVALHDRPVEASRQLPPQSRSQFVDRFSNAADGSFEVGAGQTGASLDLAAQVHSIAEYVFTHAFVDAMHPTLVLPMAVLVAAAVASVWVRGPREAVSALQEQEAAVA